MQKPLYTARAKPEAIAAGSQVGIEQLEPGHQITGYWAGQGRGFLRF